MHPLPSHSRAPGGLGRAAVRQSATSSGTRVPESTDQDGDEILERSQRVAAARMPVARGRGGRRGRVPERGADPPRRRNQRPAPLPVEREQERERLISFAEGVASWDELDELAGRLASFLQGVVSVVRPAGGRRGETAGGRRQERRGQPGVPQDVRRVNPQEHPDHHPLAPPNGRDRVAEATRIQRLYRTDRARAAREVLDGPREHCLLPRQAVYDHFVEVHDYREGPTEPLPGWPEQPPCDYSSEVLLSPFTPDEVSRRLGRMKKSSPGPDGVTYRDLHVADPDCRLLAAAFNACHRTESVPDSWKESNTVLVYKGSGDREDLGNWRPIAMGDTCAKLHAALVADRLTNWAVTNGRLSPSQKGFLQFEGCYEHSYVLQESLQAAQRAGQEIVVAWLDFKNAFGSVPHSAVNGALEGARVPASLRNIVESMYTGCRTRIHTSEGLTEPVPILAGVRQGCPLSPILFNLALEPVLHAVSRTGVGYRISEVQVGSLVYADDIALIAPSPDGMRTLLAAAEGGARSVGLEFNPRKCATLHVASRARRRRALPTVFTLQGEGLRALADGETYPHLGTPTGLRARQTPITDIVELMSGFVAVDGSLLARWQKADCVATFLLPRLDFCLRGSRVEKAPLKQADLLLKRLAKRWLNLL